MKGMDMRRMTFSLCALALAAVSLGACTYKPPDRTFVGGNVTCSSKGGELTIDDKVADILGAPSPASVVTNGNNGGSKLQVDRISKLIKACGDFLSSG